MMKPRLSVVMANHNHGDFIGRALEAILRQSWSPDEVVVVDDGSSDNSLEVIDEFAKRFPVVRTIRNAQNQGLMIAGGQAVAASSGEYIYAAAADDEILPGFFEKSMKMLMAFPEAGLCCTDAELWDSATGIITVNRLHISDGPTYLSPPQLAEVMKRTYVHIWGHTIIVKRTALNGVGGYRPELKWDSDLFASWVIGFRHGICYIPEPLARYRVTPHSFSYSSIRERKMQRRICHRIFELVKSETYKDVLPYFKKSCVLARYGIDSLCLTISKRRYRDLISARFCLRACWWEIWRSLSGIVPFSAKQLYKRVQERLSGRQLKVLRCM